VTTTSTPAGRHAAGPPTPDAPRRGHIGRVVAGSLALGVLAALVLVAAPFVPARESAVLGAVLCGFALGWAVLAVASARSTDQPQRWAVVPAAFFGLSGLLLLVSGSTIGALRWIWPPAVAALAVWIVVGVRRQLRSRTGRLMIYAVVALMALASVGGAYQTLGTAADARAHPAPGQLIDVGGHRLHLDCTGSGEPTVVLQAGGGEMSSNLGWIAPAVARDTRVCVYDRAGRGWSEPADTPQDGTQISTDLHTLLQRAHVPGPYVLAGHSFGGLYVMDYAARYPDEVAGMVLIDSTAPATAATAATAWRYDGGSYDVLGRAAALLSTSAEVGLARLYSHLEGGTLPPDSRQEVRANIATASNIRSTIDEYVQANASTQEAAALRGLGDKPLVVLTAGIGNDLEHSEAQDRLAALSTNSAHRVIDTADHEGLVADEAGAAATTRAIRDVVTSVRTATPVEP